ncbi:putative phage abortive infection protein [Lysinibacillus fusiformis]|uniref:putative phage abortive infection protein n=1 Tax=Lysinibacillus fusiformis TaxID=28031 RepID=UPI000D3C5514|nr:MULTISPECIES: putative phage abortive infection protein [Lysinibacillus]MED4668999.1 putative phage abortive infection protein [Lysinibacillus fusiformis]QAS57256.1 hypothetical protein LSP_13355 [Lysinibacillus sphaericus]RDV24975.1 hypothetical protein C7B90_23180 [Lysinibacillus fusiformis]GED63298.1 hypothetical protein LFU01_17500 [Lysinibacillus fusiformis]
MKVVTGVFILAIIVLLIYLYKKKIWVLLTSLASFLIGVLICWFFIADFNFSTDYEYYRTVVPLGALIVTTASLILTANTTKKNSEITRDTRAETTFMNMIKLNNDILKEVDEKLFSEVLNDIKEEFFKYTFMLNRGAKFINEYFDEHGEILIRELESIDISKYDNGNLNQIAGFRKQYIDIIKKRPRREVHKLWFTLNESIEDYKVELSPKNKENVFKDPFTKILMEHTSFYSEMEYKYKFDKRVLSAPVSYKEMVISCNSVFNKYYGELGHLFRNTHRIIKILNTEPLDDIKYSQFIGILRAQMSEEVLLILYYNATYTDRGIGLGRELLGSGFFGNEEDFPFYVNKNDYRALKNYKEPQHFRLNRLILPSMDCEIMSKLYSKYLLKKTNKDRKKLTNEDLFKKFEATFNSNQSNNFAKSILKRRYLKYKGNSKSDEV